jgi:hypothetical protein
MTDDRSPNLCIIPSICFIREFRTKQMTDVERLAKRSRTARARVAATSS